MSARKQILSLIIFAFGLSAGSAQATEWQDLIGKSGLDGWQQLGGAARYELEGGEIVGYAVADTPNSFLATNEFYSDFILEYEARLDDPMNSGVQFRSHVRDNGVVYGYPVEIDPTSRPSAIRCVCGSTGSRPSTWSTT